MEWHRRERVRGAAVAAAAGVLVGALAGGAAAAAPPTIPATDLTPGATAYTLSHAAAVNDQGHAVVVVDSSPDPAYPVGTYLWTPAGLTPVTANGARVQFAAFNDADQIAGWTEDAAGNRTPVLWSAGTATVLPIPGKSVTPTDLNDHGEVAAVSVAGSGANATSRAFLWDGQQARNLKLATPVLGSPFVNEAGQVAGDEVAPGGSAQYGPSVGFLWTNGKLTTLPTLAGGTLDVAGLNNLGQVAGTAAVGDGTTHAVLYRNKKLIDLGTLSGGNSAATGINDKGQVVGEVDDHSEPVLQQDGFLWSGGTMTALGIPGSSGGALGVNNLGQVTAVRRTAPTQGQTLFYVWHKGNLAQLAATSVAGLNDHGLVVGANNGHAASFDASAV